MKSPILPPRHLHNHLCNQKYLTDSGRALKTQNYFVQEYSRRGKDENVWRKYAAIKLNNGGFIQVGYDAEQFHQMINEFVIDVTKNRKVGATGFVAVFYCSLNDF